MKQIKCPKCKKDLFIDISEAIDENGEIYMCPNCKYEFRFVG